MSTELAPSGKEVVCKLHNEILAREKWYFPLIPVTPGAPPAPAK
jgi:hypothetical protein